MIEYVALSQLGDTTLEARKDILELQREVLQEKLEFIQQTLARIDIKIENYRTDIYQKNIRHKIKTRGGRPMKNFISMFLMTSLLLGDDLYNWQNERVCRFKNRIETAQQNRRIFSAAPKQTCRHRPGFCSDHGQFHLRRRLFPW